MSLDDMTKMFVKINEQSRTFEKLGSIGVSLNKTLGNQNMIGLGKRIAEINKPSILDYYTRFSGINNIMKNVFPKNIMTINGIAAATNAAITGIANNRFAIEAITQRSYIENTLGKQFGIINKLNTLKPIGLSAVDYANYRNMFQSMTSLTTKIAIQGLTGTLNNDYYEDVENTTNSISEITESVLEQKYASVDDIEKLHNLIVAFNNQILSKLSKKDLKSSLGLWISFIGLMIAIFQVSQKYFEDNGPNLSAATTKQVTNLKNDINNVFKDSVSYFRIIRYANRNCKVFLNPNLRSQILTIIPAGGKISIINSNKKWVLVTFLGNDGFPVSGWALKKYLNKISN